MNALWQIHRKKFLFAGIAALFLLLSGAGVWQLMRYAEYRLQLQKNAWVEAARKEGYTLNIQNLDIKWIYTELEIQGITWQPVSPMLSKNDSDWVFELKIAAINLNAGSLWSWLTRMHFHVDDLNIGPVQMMVHRAGKMNKKMTWSDLKRRLIQAVPPSLNGVSFSRLQIEFASLTWRQSVFQNFRIALEDVVIDREENLCQLPELRIETGKQDFLEAASASEIQLDSASFSLRENQIIVQRLHIRKNRRDSLDVLIPFLRLTELHLPQLLDSGLLRMDKLIVQNPSVRFANFPLAASDSLQRPDRASVGNWLHSLHIAHIYLNQAHVDLRITADAQKHFLALGGLSVRISHFSLDTGGLESEHFSEWMHQMRILATELKYSQPEKQLLLEARQAEYSSLTRRLDLNGLSYQADPRKLQTRMLKGNQLLYLGRFAARHLGISDLAVRELLDGSIEKISVATLQDPALTIYLDSTRLGKGSEDDGQAALKLPELLCDHLTLSNTSVTILDARKPGRKFAEVTGTDIHLSRLQTSALTAGGVPFLRSMQRYSFHVGNLRIDSLYRIRHLKARNLHYHSQTGKIGGVSVILDWADRERVIKLQTELIDGQRLYLDKMLEKRELNVGRLLISKPEIEVKMRNSAPESGGHAFFVPTLSVDELEIKNGQARVSRRDTNLIEMVNINTLFFQLYSDMDSATGKPLLRLHKGAMSIDRVSVLMDHGYHRLYLGGLRATAQDSSLSADFLRITPVFGLARPAKNTLLDLRTEALTIKPFVYSGGNLFQSVSSGDFILCKPDIKIAITDDEASTSQRMSLSATPLEILRKVTGIEGLILDRIRGDLGSLVIDYTIAGRSDKHWRFFAPRMDFENRGASLAAPLENLIRNSKVKCYHIALKNDEMEQYFKAAGMAYTGQTDSLILGDVTLDWQIYHTDKIRKKYNITGSMKGLDIAGTLQALQSKEGILPLQALHFKQPHLHFTQFHKETDFISREMDISPANRADSVAISLLLIGDLKISEGKLSWKFSDSSIRPVALRDVSVHARALQAGGKKAPVYEHLTFSTGEFSRRIADDYYTLFVRSTSFNSTNRVLNMKGVDLIPAYDIFEFARKAGWEKTRLEMSVARVNISDFDEKTLLNQQQFFTSHIHADSLWVRTFKDKRYPRRERMLPLPAQQLRELPFVMGIDSFTLSRANIYHHQISREGIKAGRLRFENLYAFGSNITNDSARLKKDATATVHGRFLLQGSGNIAASLHFDQQSEQGAFTGEGYLGHMDLTAFNEYLEPVAFTSVRSGNANNMKITFEADEQFAFGDMKFDYQKLKLMFLNKDREDGRGLGVALKTFLANSVVNSKNPRWLITKTGDVYYERDTAKEIFHYLGRIALSGLVSSIGVDKNKKIIRQIKRERMREARARREEEEALIKSEKQTR